MRPYRQFGGMKMAIKTKDSAKTQCSQPQQEDLQSP